jgi:tetratricopeptide (TPR) repeat protein
MLKNFIIICLSMSLLFGLSAQEDMDLETLVNTILLEKPDIAVSKLEKLAQQNSDNDMILGAYAIALFFNQEYDKCAEYAKKALDIFEENYIMQSYLYYVDYIQGRYENAQKGFESIENGYLNYPFAVLSSQFSKKVSKIEVDESKEMTLSTLLIYVARGMSPKKASILGGSLNLFGKIDMGLIYLFAGEYRRAKKDNKKAEIYLLEAKKLLEGEYQYYNFVLNGLSLLGSKKQTKEIVVKDAYPKFVNELYDNSLRYYKTWKETKRPNMYHKALFNIDSAITIEPNRADLRFLKGVILSETKTELQLELALTSFIQAMMLEPKNYNYELMVAQTLFNLGRYKEAIIRYKHLFSVYRKDAMDYTTLYPFTVSYIALKKEKELLTYIDEVLEKYDENNTDIWIIWAVIHKNTGNKEHAIEILDWLINNTKDSKKKEYMKFLVAKYRGEK